MTTHGTLQLLIGPVGAGKTTYARRRMCQSPAVLLDLDEWMVRLFGEDTRPEEDVLDWYAQRRERCRELIWDTAGSILACGTDVFVETGLLSGQERLAFYERARAEDRKLCVYLLDAPRSVRRRRVELRNQAATAHTQVVPPLFFELASDAWEPPDASERAQWRIVDV